MKHWLVMATLLAAPTVHALAADVAAGEKKAAVCFACHGKDGHPAMKNYPTLAGQSREYLVVALKGYRDGTRLDPIMAPMAKPLKDEDMENIAAYFAQFK
ncbi:MAG: cytochrome c [Halothiobacillaceae bacterium]